MQEPSTEQILAEFSSPSPAADASPMSDAGGMPDAAPVSQQPISEYEYTANGKTIKEPLDVILKRAAQGYNYSQHMADYKARLAEVEQKHQSALQLEQKYGEIDRYAQEHPEWNDHLRSTWQARFDITGQGQYQQGQSTQAALPPQLLQEFNEMKTFVESVRAERADQAYQSTFNKIKETYPDVDFMATDPDTGKSLEQQVLEFARDNGIQRFEPAFKAFYADRLVERARVQAREQMAADLKQRSKAGLLGTSQAPAKGQSEMEYPPGYKNMSMDQITNWLVQKYS